MRALGAVLAFFTSSNAFAAASLSSSPKATYVDSLNGNRFLCDTSRGNAEYDSDSFGNGMSVRCLAPVSGWYYGVGDSTCVAKLKSVGLCSYVSGGTTYVIPFAESVDVQCNAASGVYTTSYFGSTMSGTAVSGAGGYNGVFFYGSGYGSNSKICCRDEDMSLECGWATGCCSSSNMTQSGCQILIGSGNMNCTGYGFNFASGFSFSYMPACTDEFRSYFEGAYQTSGICFASRFLADSAEVASLVAEFCYGSFGNYLNDYGYDRKLYVFECGLCKAPYYRNSVPANTGFAESGYVTWCSTCPPFLKANATVGTTSSADANSGISHCKAVLVCGFSESDETGQYYFDVGATCSYEE